MKNTLSLFLSLFSLSLLASAQITISGTITYNGSGLAGVVLDGLPDNPVTDASGHYSAVYWGSGFGGRVMPTLAGYAFTPPYTDYIEVSSNTVTDYEAFDAGFRLDTYPIPPEYQQGGLLLGAIPIDFSHDGFIDIIAYQFCPTPGADYSVPALAYVNDGTGRFTEATAQVLGDLRTYGFVFWAVADFNGDGYDDLFLSDGGIDWPPWTGKANHLLMGQAGGTLVDECAARVPAPRDVASFGDWGDIDGDGDIDILICGTGGSYYPLINDGTGHFTYDDFRMPIVPLGFYSSAGQLLDSDHDGDLDAFFGVGNTYGDRDILLINDGNGYFERAPASALPLRAPGATGSWQNESGDVNGDGWPDILVWTDVSLQLLVNNGDGTFHDASSSLYEPAGHGLHGMKIIADLNGDGWQDMLLTAGDPRYHVNHGGNSFEDITEMVFPAKPVTTEGYNTVADIDNDGDPDILGTFDSPHGVYVLVNVLPYSIPEPPLPLPEAPFLLSPENGLTLQTVEAPLGWTSVTGALVYRLQAALDISFSQIICDHRDLTSNAFQLRGLTGNTTHFWRVRTINTRGEGPWTDAWSFTTPSTVTVSGNVTCQGAPLGGARMMDLPGQPVTDVSGHYETQVEVGWSGTARPYKTNYRFIPETTSYLSVTSDQTTDYVAYIGIPQQERQALVAFYNSTGGDDWLNKTGWKEPPLEADGFASYGSEGGWFGVTVDVMHPPLGYPTVIGLNSWDNNISGTLPANIGDLSNMCNFGIQGALGGTLPASMAAFAKLQAFVINNTNLEGSIPAWLGNNPSLMNLGLRRNRLSGTIPPELGNCASLLLLYIDGNAIVGPIPAEFMNLTNLGEGTIEYNALFADPAVQSFVESHLGTMGPQTLAPTDVSAEAQSGSSILVSWTQASGVVGYHISYSATAGGPYTFFGSAADWESSRSVDGLNPGTPYYFVVRSFSNPNPINKNLVVSAYSAEASATTLAPIIREDFVGTWDGQGVYYRNSDTGGWIKMASPATMITIGDLDGDGLDDLIGLWPTQGGIWVKYSQSGLWARLSSTAIHIAAGDMNGDGREDLLGTWDGQGVFYRNSITGAWIKMASPATLITAGDIDDDGTDDLIGIWPSQGGVWIKYSQTGAWARLSSTARDIAAGDANGDGRDDLIATWDGQGVYYRDSSSGAWVKMASEATQVACGDLDADGKADLIGIWPTQGGVWAKYSKAGAWALLGSSARDLSAGKMRASGMMSALPIGELSQPLGGPDTGPETASWKQDRSELGPGGARFAPRAQRNLEPRESLSLRTPRVPGPSEPGFKAKHEKNLEPGRELPEHNTKGIKKKAG